MIKLCHDLIGQLFYADVLYVFVEFDRERKLAISLLLMVKQIITHIDRLNKKNNKKLIYL